MPDFVKGVVQFQNDVFPQKKALFDKLSEGQSPEALFITCSDSRIETGMITQSEPGSLFVCRNAGNIVPPHIIEHSGGMTASIEFAMAVLKIPHIVICGHTGCGAMQGAMAPETVAHLPHVREWLGYSKEAVDFVKKNCGSSSEDEQVLALTERNVVLQIDHLKSHPAVAKRLDADEVTLHGWIYDIKTGEVRAYDEASDEYRPVSEHYSSILGG
ncbi:MAG: carbonic anhydrase [Marinicaulis sp.]|nr:carbonic anhydrase [Marinicaulis sp.]NNE42242.1 carbonic anhydrase [Marinicaulis sp.]NNL89138.1 carbonic anhydrase [Marinicaulis sp.]